MADNDTSQEDRQLEPSARKLQKARAEGQIARSRDLVHLACWVPRWAGSCCMGLPSERLRSSSFVTDCGFRARRQWSRR
jgi:flagellar biosynthesis protein FlhB